MRDRFVCTRHADIKFLEVRYGDEAGVRAVAEPGVREMAIADMPLDLVADAYGVVDIAKFIHTATPSYAEYHRRRDEARASAEVLEASPIEKQIDRGVGMELGTHWNEDDDARWQSEHPKES